MILPILNPWPNTCLTSQNNISNFAISVGSTICHSGPYLFNNSAKSQTHNDSGSPDLAPILCSTTATSRTKGFTAEHLSRVWRIDIPTAKRTIENTTQLCQRTENPTLSRNYSTNDCMLRYHQHFSMDTSLLQQRLRNRLEATPACSSSSLTLDLSMPYLCDPGQMFLMPSRPSLRPSEPPMPSFAMPHRNKCPEKFAPYATRCMGTTLRILKKDTPWANCAKLYIGLLKESVRKDLKISNSPLAFWDYCAEQHVHRLPPSRHDPYRNYKTQPCTTISPAHMGISPLWDNLSGMNGFTTARGAHPFPYLVRYSVAPSAQREGRGTKWHNGS